MDLRELIKQCFCDLKVKWETLVEINIIQSDDNIEEASVYTTGQCFLYTTMDLVHLHFFEKYHDIANWLGKPHLTSPLCLLLLHPQAKVDEMQGFIYRLTVDATHRIQAISPR